MVENKSSSQWRRFLDEAFAFNVARADTHAPRRIAVWVAGGLVLLIGLAVSPIGSPAVLATAGLMFGLAVAIVEAALAFRRRQD